jgi:glycosyltransferase involved in cell wall biosynthesis
MDVLRPNEIIALFAAHLQKRKSIAVVDIDPRKDSRRARTLGMISRSRFMAERLFFDPLRNLQLKWVARNCSLVLFKGQALVDDFGGGLPNVKNFFDTAHSTEHIIPQNRLDEKRARLKADESPVRLVYFGRIVERKGVDLCLRAVVEAREKFGANVSFTIIGDGPELAAVKALAKEIASEDFVSFVPPVAFGRDLFDLLYGYDMLLAAPSTEDTPRSAFDAMAAGMAICAFDTEYYRTLAGLGSMVVTTEWMSINRMAQAIADIAIQRDRLIQAQLTARQLAIENTQDHWLETRAGWTREFCGDS